MIFVDKELSRREVVRLTLLATPLGCLAGQLNGSGATSLTETECRDDFNRQTGKKKMTTKTAFVYDPIYLRHQTPPGFPESPQRLLSIVKKLEKEKLIGRLLNLSYSPNTLEWIAAVHKKEYIERVKTICQQGVGYVDSSDVPVSGKSYDAAVAAVGGVLVAVDAVMKGKVRNAFCALRPPGHHALEDRAMGFCIFNNIAIAARYIQKKHKLARVLIIDWDVHHGNGTQAAFYDDPTVFYFSVHQYPFYPGTGAASEKGTGKGLNFTLNTPLPAGCGDTEYKKVFEEKLEPAALDFKPDFILISSGFDAQINDPIGGMNVTPEGFTCLTRIVMDIARKCCSGRIVSVLEGGYNLEQLADSVAAHIKTMMKQETSALL